ncbi:TadE/TadG family type IV pilus assembly protein [Roseomonas sp. HF4]|uniref:TadE/TadG family type IV pilus assembly protein n=1 Tax=Roseomonas sp. HF4 TaxID=2562313 RepID=UPI0010C0EC0D|nr:TadE/TadG family type IV pilus assembly protein [Roseomonas sp. HF4]
MTRRPALRRDRRGAAALEFALMLPVVTFIMLGVADYGSALQQVIRLEAAARAGAQVVMSRPNDTAAIRDGVRAYVSDWPLATNCAAASPSGLCITSGQRCRAVGATSEVACTTRFTTDFQRYAWVTVTRDYTPPFIVPQRTLRGNVEIRLR